MRSLLAVQSQDYPGAKWGVGQRFAGATDTELDRAFDAGEIIRTHVMRPTWHFVAPEDLRWLLALTAPRVHQANGYQYRLLGIDRETTVQSRAVIERALDGRALVREELARALEEAGVLGSGLRLGYLIIDAELEGLICSGPRRGKRQTYALVAQRIPPSRPRERDEALAELARRYVEGHGPAQAIDLAWWSGLTVAQARSALELASESLERETIDGRAFWSAPGTMAAVPTFERPRVHLLPNYDELFVAFRDRCDGLDPELPPPARVAAEILNHVIVRNGLAVGGWRRSEVGGTYRIALNLLVSLDSAERRALSDEVARLAGFLGKPVAVTGLD